MSDNSIELLYAEIKRSAYEYINWDTTVRPCEDFFIHNDLAPKRVFYWREEDYAGSIFAIYEYKFKGKIYYFCMETGFGSCGGCDYWISICDEEIYSKDVKSDQYNLIKSYFDLFYIKEDKNTILDDYNYPHPELIKVFNQWLVKNI